MVALSCTLEDGYNKKTNAFLVYLLCHRKIRRTMGELGGFPFNDATYSCTHPTSPQMAKGFTFQATVPGGSGGIDLYFSHCLKQVSKLENMGDSITALIVCFL